ncbi:MAG TPA: hypothetical protein VN666_21715 [Nitrospira sp.]|nr:hypothetical protein [Nitrospira sp.]
MPKASEVAAELRKVADLLDREPEAEIKKPLISAGSDEKDEFLAIARLMPRPFKKTYRDWCGTPSIELDYESEAVRIWALAPRSVACRVIKPAVPAVYDCEPLLTLEEESSLEGSGL